MKEFELFLQRQHEMVIAHRENVERFSEPVAPPIPTEQFTQDTERELARIREHIRELRGELPRAIALPSQYKEQLARHGRIFDRREL